MDNNCELTELRRKLHNNLLANEIMKIIALLLVAIALSSCNSGEGPRHYRELKLKVESIGAENIVKDAFILTEQYSASIGDNQPAQRMSLENSSLTNFGKSAKVKPYSVSITTAGLGSHRAGLTIAKTEEIEKLGTNVKMIAKNIYYWSY